VQDVQSAMHISGRVLLSDNILYGSCTQAQLMHRGMCTRAHVPGSDALSCWHRPLGMHLAAAEVVCRRVHNQPVQPLPGGGVGGDWCVRVAERQGVQRVVRSPDGLLGTLCSAH
jgi:hypothetical protein